jgi:hypothetical protein
MSKKTFKFGEDYILAYGRVIWKIKRYRNKPLELRINARKRRDAQPWAMTIREDKWHTKKN